MKLVMVDAFSKIQAVMLEIFSFNLLRRMRMGIIRVATEERSSVRDGVNASNSVIICKCYVFVYFSLKCVHMDTGRGRGEVNQMCTPAKKGGRTGVQLAGGSGRSHLPFSEN